VTETIATAAHGPCTNGAVQQAACLPVPQATAWPISFVGHRRPGGLRIEVLRHGTDTELYDRTEGEP
jgi:hypothetical protein